MTKIRSVKDVTFKDGSNFCLYIMPDGSYMMVQSVMYGNDLLTSTIENLFDQACVRYEEGINSFYEEEENGED